MNETWRALRNSLPAPPDFEYDWQGLGECPGLDEWFARMATRPRTPGGTTRAT